MQTVFQSGLRVLRERASSGTTRKRRPAPLNPYLVAKAAPGPHAAGPDSSCLIRQHATCGKRPRPGITAAAKQGATAQTIQLRGLGDTEALQVAEGAENRIPTTPGIYAVYDSEGVLQYIGMSRKVVASVAQHARDIPELTRSIKCASFPSANKDILTAAWKAWVQEAVNETGKVPPGNASGNTVWSVRRKAKPEIKLTPGKGAQDLSVPITDLIDSVVKTNKVVAFVKGTRTEPQCGFSHKVMSMLNELRVEYEVVNVLDDVYNPGLREAIKTFSQWPTIPQVYVNGEFVGGADVLEEMHAKGELKAALS